MPRSGLNIQRQTRPVNDEGDGERVEEERPEEPLAAVLTLDHRRQDEAEDDRERAADGQDQITFSSDVCQALSPNRRVYCRDQVCRQSMA